MREKAELKGFVGYLCRYETEDWMAYVTFAYIRSPQMKRKCCQTVQMYSLVDECQIGYVARYAECLQYVL